MENRDAILKKLEPLRTHFPKFHAKLCEESIELFSLYDEEYIYPSASVDEITQLEARFGLSLPRSYKQFLSCVRGFAGDFTINRTPITVGGYHPFMVERAHMKGKLCVADYFLEADGDQIYLDARQGLINDEYPVLYYAHDFAPEPRCFRKVADSFGEWLESL
jgi:hypothetical protein